jgi:hypothetical protein
MRHGSNRYKIGLELNHRFPWVRAAKSQSHANKYWVHQELKQLLKRILWQIYPNGVFRLIPASKNQFSIGIYTGMSPFDLKPAPLASNPVLARGDITEAPAGTVADPFMLKVGDVWYMFFEIVNQFHNKGEIALATSRDAYDWKFMQIVLAERFHMSYPQVFEWQDNFYMIPETSRDKSVRIYKAARFPYDWKRVATILEGSRFADSSVFRFKDMWWLFTDAGQSNTSPTLRLYFAESLFGPWREHPESPICSENPKIGRPAGRVVIIDGIPYRFTQNVYPVYGTEVRALEIVELTTKAYSERMVGDSPIIGAGTEAWNRHGMHHIDLHSMEDGSWLACVDGCVRRNLGDL